MRKSDCTPEQWEAYKARAKAHYARNKAAIRERRKAQAQTDEAKERRRQLDADPVRKEQRRARDRANGPAQWARIKADPDRHAAHREGVQKWRTGFSNALVEVTLERQGGVCGVCRRPMGRLMRRDHDHATGEPRGLLCHPCNIIEGMMSRSGLSPIDFAENMILYLKHPPASST